MSTTFDSVHGLVLVQARLTGPREQVVARLALDTGATQTMINSAVLQLIGCDPGSEVSRIRVTTASGVEFVPRIGLDSLEALGIKRDHFFVL